MISASEALKRLQEGNRRFVSGTGLHDSLASEARRSQLVAGQRPFACILGCSDSRVPAELIFDQGLGDLFVIRVAGNIVAPSQVGSVEFTAEQFGTRLVVVLGHSGCGAVSAALETLGRPDAIQSPNLRLIIDYIQPSLQMLSQAEPQHKPEALLKKAIRANVQTSANHLRKDSQILNKLIQKDGLMVLGAEYSLETGLVDFFEGLPAS